MTDAQIKQREKKYILGTPLLVIALPVIHARDEYQQCSTCCVSSVLKPQRCNFQREKETVVAISTIAVYIQDNLHKFALVDKKATLIFNFSLWNHIPWPMNLMGLDTKQSNNGTNHSSQYTRVAYHYLTVEFNDIDLD